VLQNEAKRVNPTCRISIFNRGELHAIPILHLSLRDGSMFLQPTVTHANQESL
jgi:hypothetical protein